MLIPRPVIVAFLIAVSVVAGWLLSSALQGEIPTVHAREVLTDSSQPTAAPPAMNVYLPAQEPPTITMPAQAPPTVNVTIVNVPSETNAPTAESAQAPNQASPATGRSPARQGSSGTLSGVPSQTGSVTPRATETVAPGPRATSPLDGLVLQLTPEVGITGIGEHIVIAYDGSIVYVGDDGSLTANTGDAALGGTVALDAQSSSLSSNYAPDVLVAGPGQVAGAASSPGMAGVSTTSAQGVISGGSYADVPSNISPLASAFALYTANRTADVAGFEDHSVLVRGLSNIVTYDDSNVFMNRDGKINANTGDTDSAGLNAIAVLRSTVSAGPHCDDGCDDESIIQAEAGVFDEGDVAIDGNGNVVWAPDAPNESPTDDDSQDDSLPQDNGDDDDSAGDESPDGDVSDPEEPAETRDEADTTRPDADTGVDPVGTPADGSLTVGGDGIDDLSERVDGVGNVATYDDSNVVIGGAGNVNAQIGDSDTGGTVVMDVVDSTVSGGNSR